MSYLILSLAWINIGSTNDCERNYWIKNDFDFPLAYDACMIYFEPIYFAGESCDSVSDAVVHAYTNPSCTSVDSDDDEHSIESHEIYYASEHCVTTDDSMVNGINSVYDDPLCTDSIAESGCVNDEDGYAGYRIYFSQTGSSSETDCVTLTGADFYSGSMFISLYYIKDQCWVVVDDNSDECSATSYVFTCHSDNGAKITFENNDQCDISVESYNIETITAQNCYLENEDDHGNQNRIARKEIIGCNDDLGCYGSDSEWKV